MITYKYNIGDRVKFYDHEFEEHREVNIVGFDVDVDYPSYEVKEDDEEATWFLAEDSIERLA